AYVGYSNAVASGADPMTALGMLGAMPAAAGDAQAVAQMVQIQVRNAKAPAEVKALNAKKHKVVAVMIAPSSATQTKAVALGQMARAVVAKHGQMTVLRGELARTERLATTDARGARLADLKKRIMK